MKEKKHTTTVTQKIGILWLSIAFVLMAAAAFFSSRRGYTEHHDETKLEQASKILAEKEDSAYRSRRNDHYHSRKTTNRPSAKAEPTKAEMYSREPAPTRKQPLVVEINSADTITLQLLHGIGPAYARRIVRYRERLGGFATTEQLLEVYGFTPELLQHIAGSLELDTTRLRHIEVNRASIKQLARHPYIEYYQARDIVRLREEGVTFGCIDDLAAVPSMADSTLRRIAPYLDFGMADSISPGSEP